MLRGAIVYLAIIKESKSNIPSLVLRILTLRALLVTLDVPHLTNCQLL